MRKIVSVGGWLLFALFFAVQLVGAASAPDKIRFPYSPMSWNSLPWWMAKDAGHFERNGLDVDLFYEGASSVIVQAMLAGEANFAGLAVPAVVSKVINGGDGIENGIAARRRFVEKNPSIAKRFIRAAFEGIQSIYTNKELSIKTLAKYTKVNDEKILDESYRFSVEGLSKEGFMPPEAFSALVEQLVSQKSIDEAASKKLPLTSYFDNRYVNELEKEGFFKKLWQ